MTATQRARARVPLEQRSIVPTTAGIPWWGAILTGVAGAFVGYILDAARGNELTSVFAVFYFLGCVAAVLAVQSRSLFSAMVQPPLILFIGVPLAYKTLTTDTGHGIKNLILDLALPLVDRFPMMVFTTIVVLAIGGVRIYLKHQEASPAAAARRASSRRTSDRRKPARRRETTPRANSAEPTTGRRRAAGPATARRRAASAEAPNRRRSAEYGRTPTGEFGAADTGARRARTDDRHARTEDRHASRSRTESAPPRRHAERPQPAMAYSDDDYRLSDPTVTFPMPSRRMAAPATTPAPRHPRPRVPLRAGADPHPTMSTPIPRVRYRDRDDAAYPPLPEPSHTERPRTSPGWTAPQFGRYEDG